MSNEVQDDLENTEQSEEIEESEVTSVEVTPDMLEEDSSEDEVEDVQTQLESKELELRQATEKHLRLAAEYDNFRKRTIREKEDFHKFASSSMVEKLLPVLDTVSRGVEFNKTADSIESVREGLEKSRQDVPRDFEV